MAIELSTAGILVKWAVESTEGTRPTTGYVALKGIKSISELNPDPNMLDVTDLSDTTWKRNIPGLKDSSSVQSFTVNDYTDFRDGWAAMMTAYTTAASAGKALWIEYYVPGLKEGTTQQSFFYAGVPETLGFNGAEVDAVYENVAKITPNKIVGWAASSST